MTVAAEVPVTVAAEVPVTVAADLPLAGNHPAPLYDLRYIVLVVLGCKLGNEALGLPEVDSSRIKSLGEAQWVAALLRLVLDHLENVGDHFPLIPEFGWKVEVVDGEENGYFVTGVVESPVLVDPHAHLVLVVDADEFAVDVERAEALVDVVEGVEGLPQQEQGLRKGELRQVTQPELHPFRIHTEHNGLTAPAASLLLPLHAIHLVHLHQAQVIAGPELVDLEFSL